MDGLLLCPVNKGPEFERFLLDLPVPVVTMGHWVSDKIPLVGIEEYEAGADGISSPVPEGVPEDCVYLPGYEPKKRGEEQLYS